MFDNPKITARLIRLHMRPMSVTLDLVTPRLNDATMAAIQTGRATPQQRLGRSGGAVMGYTLLHKRSGACIVLSKAALDAFAAENDMTEWQVL